MIQQECFALGETAGDLLTQCSCGGGDIVTKKKHTEPLEHV